MKRILIGLCILLSHTAVAGERTSESDMAEVKRRRYECHSKARYSTVKMELRCITKSLWKRIPSCPDPRWRINDPDRFRRVIPILAKHRQLICIELQAHGRTEDRNAPLSFDRDADDVASLLGNLSIPADFFGFSNGANTALERGCRSASADMQQGYRRVFLLKRSGTFTIHSNR